MTRWLWLLVVPGGSVIVAVLAVRWLVRRRHQQSIDAELDTLIKPPVRKFDGHDEALAKRTQQRREAADRMRGRAAQVESGAPVSALLRRVK